MCAAFNNAIIIHDNLKAAIEFMVDYVTFQNKFGYPGGGRESYGEYNQEINFYPAIILA